MPFKVEVGPPQIAIHQAQTVLVTDPDGQVTWPSDKGLYFFDTRLISAWAIYANGEPWDLLNGGAITYDAARDLPDQPRFLTEDGAVPARSLGFVLSRRSAAACTRISISPTTARKHVRFNLEIAIRSDFADIFEVKSGRIVRRGRITTEWSERPAGTRHARIATRISCARCISARNTTSAAPSMPMAG